MSSSVIYLSRFLAGFCIFAVLLYLQSRFVLGQTVSWPLLIIQSVLGGLVASFISLFRSRTKDLLNQLSGYKKRIKELEKLSTIDGLTELANRHKLDKSLDKEISRLTRSNDPLTLMLCDIDGFKEYNDKHERQGGDELLRKIAHTIRQYAKRRADLVARYGDDEFCLLLPNTTLTEACALAEKLRAAIENLKIKRNSADADQYVTISIGVSCAFNIPSDFDKNALFYSTDKALYQAKDRGRNTVVCIDDLMHSME